MSELKIPFYLRSTIILLGVILTCFLIYIGTEVFVPLGFAMLLAILFHPMVRKLEKRGVSRIISIICALIVGFLVVGGIIFFLITQFSNFSEALPQLKERFNELLLQLQTWLSTEFGVSTQRQLEWIRQGTEKGTELLGTTFSAFTGALVIIFIIPVYVFLLLYYRPLLVRFIQEVFSGKDQDGTIAEVLAETKQVVQSYMIGLLIETTIVATLNSIAYLIIGIEYAIVLGVICGLLNMIPYIGGLIGASVTAIIAIITGDSITPGIAVIGAYIVIQFIDNNILVPRIVASKVRINALVSILAVILGSMIAGTAGMFLSLPTIAILKIIFDRVESLQPWGRLLGDDMPAELKLVKEPLPLNEEKKTIAKDTDKSEADK